jgi:ferritin
MQDALNRQLNMELQAYYTYLSMSAFFEDAALKGFASWMFHHCEEEMTHAMKIYNFILSRRGRVKLDAISQPPHDWSSPLDAINTAMGHEQAVTQAIHELVKLAREEGDYPTDSFLQWFVDEQVEEEEIVDELIQKLTLIGDFSPGLYLLDRELGEATPEAEGAA